MLKLCAIWTKGRRLFSTISTPKRVGILDKWSALFGTFGTIDLCYKYLIEHCKMELNFKKTHRN